MVTGSKRLRKQTNILRKLGLRPVKIWVPDTRCLRPVKIWVPDTRCPGFDEECRRQSMLVAAADAADPDLAAFMDATLIDLEDVS